MKEIKLKPVKITRKLLDKLAKRGLITTLKATPGCLKESRVDLIYETSAKYGPQKLICVGKKDLNIQMTIHGDKEELLILNSTTKKFKPLYLIIAMDKIDVFNRKVKQGKLKQWDILAVELKYNDPETSIFMMNSKVPHCEVTLPGKEQHPVFFVTEPVNLSYAVIPTPGYKITVSK